MQTDFYHLVASGSELRVGCHRFSEKVLLVIVAEELTEVARLYFFDLRRYLGLLDEASIAATSTVLLFVSLCKRV